MSPRPSAAHVVTLVAFVLLAAGCSGEVVDGTGSRAGRSSSSTNVAPSGAAFRDPGAAAVILRDARAGVAATNSYDYRSLPSARANGLTHVTGAYRDQYTRAFDSLIARNAPPQRFVQRAVVDRIGLGPVDGTGATVLAFGALNISNRTAKRVDRFGVAAHLTKVGSRWLLDRLSLDRAVDGTAPGGAPLTAAVAAARSGTRGLLTFTRASFAADFRAALSATTGGLRRDVLTQRGATLSSMTKGGFDLTADVRGTAVESAAGTTAVVLVSIDGYRVTNGARGTATEQNLAVTVVRQGGRWLLNDITAIGTP